MNRLAGGRTSCAVACDLTWQPMVTLRVVRPTPPRPALTGDRECDDAGLHWDDLWSGRDTRKAGEI